MTLAELQRQIHEGLIDTVLVAFPDPFGRLVGKRFHAEFFIKSVLDHGTHACNYLLTVNIEMDPLNGFQVANWESGFGDFEMRPDPDAITLLPWQPGSAIVLCDYVHHDGKLVSEAPRSILRTQLKRLELAGYSSLCASELEFYLFNQTYSSAFASGYKDLAPSSDYRIDYHLLQTSREEPLMRTIRNQLSAAGIPVESSKGEWSRGQHEVNLTYGPPLLTADRHVLFKHGVKEIAAQHGKAASFLPKIAPEEAGNSCHIHLSLWQDGTPSFWDTSAHKESLCFRQVLGGLIKYSPELCLLFAPTINAYKRYQQGSWAPTHMAWGTDNRTVGFRVVGHERSFRIENRMPGADANPYLAFSAMIAAAIAGIEENLDCGDAYIGNAYTDPKLTRLPSSLSEAATLFENSTFARKAFGDDVVNFYTRHARIEAQAFAEAVTDWEKRRYFEQI